MDGVGLGGEDLLLTDSPVTDRIGRKVLDVLLLQFTSSRVVDRFEVPIPTRISTGAYIVSHDVVGGLSTGSSTARLGLAHHCDIRCIERLSLPRC